MNRLLAGGAVLAAIVAIPASALAERGQTGAPGPEGNPNYDSTQTAETGAPAEAPGNSGNNPHGGPGGSTAGGGQSTGAPTGGEAVAPAPTTPAASPQSEGSSNAAEPAPAGAGGNGGGPADKITICHATGSETNPYVVITVSENATTGNGHGNGPAHQNDEDVIPAGSGGSCPSTAVEPPTVIEDDGDSGVLGQPDGSGRPDRAAPSAPSAAPASEPRGELPFTGMFVGALLIAGLVAMTGGIGLRRASHEAAGDTGRLAGLSRRRGELTGRASAWEDSIAARTTELGERIATLERSLSD